MSIVPTAVPVSRCRPGTIITERVEENAVREARIVRKSSDTTIRSVAIPSLVNLCVPGIVLVHCECNPSASG